MKKTYEIYNLTTGEVLADNLKFDDVPELFGAYMQFFPDDDIIVCCRETKISVACARIISEDEHNRHKFYSEWFAFMEELLIMDNIH